MRHRRHYRPIISPLFTRSGGVYTYNTSVCECGANDLFHFRQRVVLISRAIARERERE